LVADVTNEVEHDEMQREKRETFALFEHMLADRSGFLGFMEEATQIVARVLASGVELGELKRAVHTLKGNSMFFGLESVARLCHDLEGSLADGLRTEDLTRLSERWERLSADVDRLLGERRNIIEIAPEEQLALEQAVQRGASREALERMVHELKLEPVDRRLQQFAAQARQIAERVGKQIEVEVSHDGVRLDAKRWSPFWAAFVHGIRNAIDHGIEPPTDRSKAGKPKAGRIALAARREAGKLVIDIEDDGVGIDWEAIRRRGASLGLPSATHENLVAALFAEGLSTARAVTELSGRGVGMAALRSAVLALDGHISVKSERGLGTRLSMTFPTLAAVPEPQRLPAATEPVLHAS
jgi:two-component system chemotaxis sensor kinase CheA